MLRCSGLSMSSTVLSALHTSLAAFHAEMCTILVCSFHFRDASFGGPAGHEGGVRLAVALLAVSGHQLERLAERERQSGRAVAL